MTDTSGPPPIGGWQHESDLALPLFHGGRPGLTPGDVIRPGVAVGHGGEHPVVWITNDLLTAAVFAHCAVTGPRAPDARPMWEGGTVYEVRPVGRARPGASSPSGGHVARESWQVSAAKVMSVVAHKVNLPERTHRAILASSHPQHMYRPMIDLLRERVGDDLREIPAHAQWRRGGEPPPLSRLTGLLGMGARGE